MKYQRKPRDQNRVKQGRYQVRVLKERCKECGICIEFCPQQVFRESTELNQRGYHIVGADDSRCVNCGLCEPLCPDFALSVAPLAEGKTSG